MATKAMKAAPKGKAAAGTTGKSKASLAKASLAQASLAKPAAMKSSTAETYSTRQIMALTGKGKSRISQLCNPRGDKPATLEEGTDWRFERTNRVFTPNALTKLLKPGEDYKLERGKVKLAPHVEKVLAEA